MNFQSCRHDSYIDAANPKRMQFGKYCVDSTADTADAGGAVENLETLYLCVDRPEIDGKPFFTSPNLCGSSLWKSCRNKLYNDTGNLLRMKYGSYCVDLTKDTRDATGTLLSSGLLQNCPLWSFGGKTAFEPSNFNCKSMSYNSCRNNKFTSEKNPKRRAADGAYCADRTESTMSASGLVLTTNELETCSQWNRTESSLHTYIHT